MITRLITRLDVTKSGTRLIGLFIFLAIVAISIAGTSVAVRGSNNPDAETLITGILFLVFMDLVSLLPAMLVVTYKGTQEDSIRRKVGEALWLCGIEVDDFKQIINDFERKNSDFAFIVPTILLVILLTMMWALATAPNGLSGYREYLGDHPLFNGKEYFEYLVNYSSLVTWAFIGAYFYTVTALASAWRRADLTANVLWSFVIRILLAIFLGLILTMVAGSDSSPAINAFRLVAFIGGITPNAVFVWLFNRMRPFLNFNSVQGTKGVFQDSDLQQKIDGIDYYIANRLALDDIDSLQSLANIDLSALLVKTRYDIPTLLNWVDQAILHYTVGENAKFYVQVGIKTASGLLQGLEKHGSEKLCQAMSECSPTSVTGTEPSESAVASPISVAILDIVTTELMQGANLPYVRAFFENSSSPEKRNRRLRSMPKFKDSSPSRKGKPERKFTRAA